MPTYMQPDSNSDGSFQATSQYVNIDYTVFTLWTETLNLSSGQTYVIYIKNLYIPNIFYYTLSSRLEVSHDSIILGSPYIFDNDKMAIPIKNTTVLLNPYQAKVGVMFKVN